MKSTFRFTAMAAVFVLSVGVAPTAWAEAPQQDPALTFSVLAGHPDPTSGAGPVASVPNTYGYFFSTPYGTELNETIPFYVCLASVTNPGGFTWSTNVKIQSGPTAGVPGITPSATSWHFDNDYPVRDSETYADPANDPACQSAYLSIATLPLEPVGTLPETLTSNTNFAMDGQGTSSNPANGKGKTESSVNEPSKIQIKVEVTEPVASDRISCYLTDSEGNVLQTCEGALADESGEQDGTFSIVANKKGKAVATNPGQFYYNLFWKNATGSDQAVNVAISKSANLSANGTQAVHWWILPTASGVDLNDFETVNAGNPAGTSGSINGIVVPADETLYVTYHLEWNGTGANAPDCGACGDAQNEPVSVVGNVSGSFPASPDTCTAGALGFNKH